MNEWMRIACDEALQGMEKNEGGPFGAAIVREGKIIASAHNEVLGTNDPTAHAEINAIRRASAALGKFDLSDCTLYTTCYPCPMCMGAIFWARIPTVYYASSMNDAAEGGFDDRIFYEMIRSPESTLDLRPVDTEKSKKLFKLWEEKEDKKLY
ncbi:MAG TPA: tRNA-specific adenosine deaminase [Sulfuricurvum kujiense]|uniref:tRNA-specific adenosine deaminase n=4 Tax=Sulfuricurvum TaxID=286130 RepID=A0A2D3WJV1_9BACT|nr:nucleoside deaminase [Sulfuricurvum kujiense]DAB37994.1 MAG TPA: tRNA-specific adenosine deaminase [Sulfuricurvum kujiense]